MALKKSKLFFGWWIVLASGILTFWGQGIGNFGFSALFKPIASELGLSMAATSVAAGIGKFEGCFISPVVGWLTDKFGPRWMVLSGVSIIGLSLILMNFVNSLWAFYLVWGVLLGTGANIGLMIPLDKTVADWFVKKRGRALTTKWLFMALAAVLMVPLVAWLVSVQGWRMTCVTAGVVMLIIGLPLAWFFIKQRRPEYYGLLPDGAAIEEMAEVTQTIDRGVEYAAEVQEIEFTLRQGMRTPAYWLLTLAVAGFNMVGTTFVIHSVPLLTDMGIDPVKAAVMIGLVSAAVIPGTFIGMFMADRIKKQHLRFLISGAYFLHVIGLTVFLLNPTLGLIYPVLIIHHFVAGIHGSLTGVTLARYFGRKAFGSIRGTSLTFLLPFSVAAPIYAGWIYDTTSSYQVVFLLATVCITLSTIMMSLAFPPKSPAQVSDIREII